MHMLYVIPYVVCLYIVCVLVVIPYVVCVCCVCAMRMLKVKKQTSSQARQNILTTYSIPKAYPTPACVSL